MRDEVTEDGDLVDDDVALQVSLQQAAAAAAAAGDRDKLMGILTTLVHEFPGFKEGTRAAVERNAGREPGTDDLAR